MSETSSFPILPVDQVVTSDWDVVVVGGGPAGSMAARAAARSGSRTLLIDRSRFPRYKVCGGGLIGASLAALPGDVVIPSRDMADSVTFTSGFDLAATRRADSPFMTLINRAEFDEQLLASASASGAAVATGVRLREIAQEGDEVVLTTSVGEIRARTVVGADGSSGITSHYVGAAFEQVDLGLEVELDVPAVVRDQWRGRLHLDFGRVAGSYAWVFPKGDTLTVGAIAAKGNSAWEKRYLDAFLASLGLDGYVTRPAAGHVTHCRRDSSPLSRGRVLLCGDAAGLMEPWTREGISFALRSGHVAGKAAAALVADAATVASVTRSYADQIDSTLGAEMRGGRDLFGVFERHPRAFHLALARTGTGWRAFERLSRSDTTFARVMNRRVARVAVRVFG